LQAKTVIKCLNNEYSSIYIKSKLKETLFATRRQPRVGKFFNNVREKLANKVLKFMDDITEDWIGLDLTDGVIRRLLKKAYFKSYN